MIGVRCIDPLDPSVVRDNVDVISKFPNHDGAQIKATRPSGALYSAGEWYQRAIQKVNYVNPGTDLENTVEYIHETACRYLLDFRSLIEGKFNDMPALRKLNQRLIEVLKFCRGINNIHAVYQRRYAATPEKIGLKELAAIRNGICDTQYLECTRRYSQIIDEFKAQPAGIDFLTDTLIFPQIVDEVSPKDAASSLSLYCQKYCPGIEWGLVQDHILKGEILFEQVMSGKAMSMSKDRDEAEIQCAQLTWYFMSEAIKKGQGYEEGTFVLQDPNDCLYNFLKSALHGYERHSSHYVGRSEELHRGVDVFNEQMPAQKRTLLFEKLLPNPFGKQIPLLFIKPENFSANPLEAYDFAMHGIEFFQAQSRKIFGGDDEAGMRKERVPVKLLKEFKKQIDVLKSFKPGEGLTNERFLGLTYDEVKTHAKTYGISFMKHFMEFFVSVKDDQIEMGPPMPAEGFDPVGFLAMLEEYDNLDLRTGREVILG